MENMENPVSSHPIQAWEEDKSFFDSFKAMLRLCGALLFKPVEVFSRLKVTPEAGLQKRFTQAILFAFVFGYLKLVFDVVYLSWFHQLGGALSPVTIFSSPLFLLRPVISFVVTASLIAFSVKLILGFQKPLWPILLIVAYKSAAEIFYFIPVVGVLLAGVWSVALLAVGIKEFYSVSMVRSILATIIMPLVILLFIFLSLGPSLNKAIMALYPEAKKQIVVLNDTNAYFSVKALSEAAQAYKQDLGFYPVHLGGLKKYLSGSVVDDAANPDNLSGYIYDYTKIDDNHFILLARPNADSYSGRFVFYADETAMVRLNDRQGPVVKDIKALQDSSGDAAQQKARGER